MLRKRNNRRYNEETNDEEDTGRKFDIQEQIRSERFDQIKDKHLQELNGEAITLKLIQRDGFDKPILVKEPHGLDLRVPPKSFHVRDVRNCVGHQRIIDVMDVKTQKNIDMSMKDWCKYYESRNRDRLLNVISLEFSHTPLDELVEAPMIVKLLDWVDLVWPKFLKESQTESTNTIDKMKYPKVQKYCLMSVKGSYTDFHIDFGGTSVWYHIIRGKKIFWMVPPTELNLQTFEEWTLSGMQQDVFFGDTVEECFRVELTAGNTFFIPSGWIHAVYTMEDSLVFGGNFLHSFGIENQLKVSKIEDATKVPIKFRYPFYTEILWYVAQHYVHCLTGKDHLHRPDTIATTNSTPEKRPNDIKVTKMTRIQDDVDNETTESEQDEFDTKEKSSTTRNKRRARPSKEPVKKSKKQELPSDDESTEIDSANEEDNIKPAEKKSANTCRMTKNSLLRLQYEIDERNSSQPNYDSRNKSAPKRQKIKNESISDPIGATDQQQTQQDDTSPNSEPTKMKHVLPSSGNSRELTDMMLSHESGKLTCWSSNGAVGAQTTWSNDDSDTKEPLKIHLTKYELNGLKLLVKHLSKLSGAKKNLPTLIRNSRALLDDCRKLIVEHENDDPELAITGKPITTEILNPKKATLSELIEQFFKPSESIDDQHSPLIYSPNTSIKSMKSDSSTLTHQHRLKLGAIDEKKTPTNSSDATTTKLLSPHKDTKCLSPNKKCHTSLTSSLSSTTQSTVSSAASALPRPKSPPTRPISNNQYKTKNNNTLLLPGSFADLIAATSTEKKAFDVEPSDITSSLFGMKESSPVKSTVSHSKTIQMKEKDKMHDPIKMMHNISKPHPVQADHLSPDKPAGLMPISPEPPKPCPQKRFINPAFRPQVKEKLIFASAPYVSPVNASDQGRPGDLYPWQSPAPPQHHQTQGHNQRPHHKPAETSSTLGVIQHSSYTPDAGFVKPSDNSNDSKPNVATPPGDTGQGSTQASPDLPTPRLVSAGPANLFAPNQKSIQPSNDAHNDTSQESRPTPKFTPKLSTIIKPIESKSSKLPTTKPPQQSPQVQDTAEKTVANSNDEVEEKSKRPNKPRGPPKKSKEARQALESGSYDNEVSAVPTSVIKLAPVVPSSVVQKAPQAAQSLDAKDKPEKPKPKRKSKPKDNNETSKVHPPPTPTTSQGLQTVTMNNPATRLPICGIVAPSMVTTTAQPKGNPQQYLISRPLLFNTMAGLTTAQLQQMSRAHMPLLTNSMPSTMSLPHMQQGARIVWATQPRQFMAPATSVPVSVFTPTTVNPRPLSTKPGPMMTVPTTAPMAQPPDNAALLSLATTALSTAPLSTSPALSHLGARPPANQAIMVSSAGSQPTIYTNQQFLSSLMQRIPMAQFGPPSSGIPRQPGQLVFARLPNQAQPRYLITQPGLLPHRSQIPIVAGQPGQAMPFAQAYNPDPSKTIKTKKVKTN